MNDLNAGFLDGDAWGPEKRRCAYEHTQKTNKTKRSRKNHCPV